MDKFSIKINKQDKGVGILFKEVTTLVPYAIFLCGIAFRQNTCLCIYLDVTHDSSIEMYMQITFQS